LRQKRCLRGFKKRARTILKSSGKGDEKTPGEYSQFLFLASPDRGESFIKAKVLCGLLNEKRRSRRGRSKTDMDEKGVAMTKKEQEESSALEEYLLVLNVIFEVARAGRAGSEFAAAVGEIKSLLENDSQLRKTVKGVEG